MTRQNLDKIYRKKTIDTELLLLISKALDYDFFSLFSEEFRTSKGISSQVPVNAEVATFTEELEKCKAERDSLKNLNEHQQRSQSMMQKYIALLEDKLESVTGQRAEGGGVNSLD